MARLLYSLLLTLLLPLMLTRLFIKGSSDNRYRRNIGDRLGKVTRDLGKIDVWIHAVSVGEVNAATPLVTAFQTKRPRCRILITTTTPTGLDQVTVRLGDRVVHCYLPFDHPFFIARFLRTISPRLLIIMERELWPNIIHGCHKRSIPVVIANARLSQRSCHRYACVLPLMRPTLTIVSAVAAQTEADRSRLMTLGAHPDRILTTGNIKYDVTVPTKTMDTARSMRQDWGCHRLIIVAGSTHEGEEAVLLDILDPLREHYPGLLLILAPRHPERFDAVFRLVRDRGFNTHRHGDGYTVVPPSAEVHLRDSMGELPLLYAAADVAIVGGSLIEIKGIGGHNLLEPCAVATPVLFGRYIPDFLEIGHNIVKREAGIQVHDPNELSDALKKLLNDEALRNRMGVNGLQVIKENRGATQRTLELCMPLIESDLLVKEHKHASSQR
jgi:3-deoxy-D-manno-octulosonic-acid transferase